MPVRLGKFLEPKFLLHRARDGPQFLEHRAQVPQAFGRRERGAVGREDIF